MKVNNVNPAECGGKAGVLKFPSSVRALFVTRAQPSWTFKGQSAASVCVEGDAEGLSNNWRLLTCGFRNPAPPPPPPPPPSCLQQPLLALTSSPRWLFSLFWGRERRRKERVWARELGFAFLCIGRLQIYSKGDWNAPTSLKCHFDVSWKCVFQNSARDWRHLLGTTHPHSDFKVLLWISCPCIWVTPTLCLLLGDK